MLEKNFQHLKIGGIEDFNMFHNPHFDEYTEKFISTDLQSSISDFKYSDEPAVENFLKNEALNLHKTNTANTRLFFDLEGNLVGYFTLFNDIVSLGKGKKEKLGWQLEMIKYFPAVRLHFMGVDENHRGKRIGEYLLMRAFEITQNISRESGCNFLTVEALNSAVIFMKNTSLKD